MRNTQPQIEPKKWPTGPEHKGPPAAFRRWWRAPVRRVEALHGVPEQSDHRQRRLQGRHHFRQEHPARGLPLPADLRSGEQGERRRQAV